VFLTSALELLLSRPCRVTPRERTPGTLRIGGFVDPRFGLDHMEKWKFLTILGLHPLLLDRPARSQSLYRLSHRGSRNFPLCNVLHSDAAPYSVTESNELCLARYVIGADNVSWDEKQPPHAFLTSYWNFATAADLCIPVASVATSREAGNSVWGSRTFIYAKISMDIWISHLFLKCSFFPTRPFFSFCFLNLYSILSCKVKDRSLLG
jgi:hypothetical protein